MCTPKSSRNYLHIKTFIYSYEKKYLNKGKAQNASLTLSSLNPMSMMYQGSSTKAGQDFLSLAIHTYDPNWGKNLPNCHCRLLLLHIEQCNHEKAHCHLQPHVLPCYSTSTFMERLKINVFNIPFQDEFLVIMKNDIVYLSFTLRLGANDWASKYLVIETPKIVSKITLECPLFNVMRSHHDL